MSSRSKRPKPNPLIRTSLEWGLEWISFAGVALAVLWTLWMYQTLPDKIPLHFNLKGEVDGYGSKAVIWIIIGVAVIMIAMLQAILKIPDQYNYPIQVTQENAQKLYRLTQHYLLWIKAIISVIFFGLIMLILETARLEHTPWWSFWFIVLSLVSMVVVVYYLLRSSKRLKQKNPVQ